MVSVHIILFIVDINSFFKCKQIQSHVEDKGYSKKCEKLLSNKMQNMSGIDILMQLNSEQKHLECRNNLIEMELPSKINTTDFYTQEQSAIHTVLFKAKAWNSPILRVTIINKLTFNRILRKNWLSNDLFCARTMTLSFWNLMDIVCQVLFSFVI